MEEIIKSSPDVAGFIRKSLKGFKNRHIKSRLTQDLGLDNLQMQAELASKLFDEMPASVIVIDEKGTILAVNKNFTIYTSKEGQAMVGRSLLSTTEIKNPKLAQKYRDLLKEGKPFSGHILKHHAELQDKTYTMSLSAVPLRNSSGKVVGAVSIAQDVTFLNEIEEELRVANEKLSKRLEENAAELVQQQQQLEQSLISRNQFFADASHELRTPLTIVKGNLDLIFMKAHKNSLPLALLEKLTTMNEEVKRMSELLEDITFLNRSEDIRQHLNLSLVSLDMLVTAEAKEFFGPAEKKNIQLSFSTESVDSIIDEKAIKKVVRNLLSNALRYTGRGGKISLALNKEKEYAFIKISDTGMGIAKQDLSHIFDRFYRADKVRNRVDGGSGLGLAICQQIIHQHGGKIKVISQLGKGSEFTIVLPLKRQRPTV